MANVSHELRTPLTTIKGYAETLLEGALNEDVAPRFIEIIKRHTDRLTKIVEDLLTLSTIESREFSLTLETISLSELIDDVIDFVKEPAGKKRISITRGDLASSLSVHGDRKHLEQVLINLVDNAIKYGREDGRGHGLSRRNGGRGGPHLDHRRRHRHPERKISEESLSDSIVWTKGDPRKSAEQAWDFPSSSILFKPTEAGSGQRAHPGKARPFT